jgi:hypothetical protein
MARKPTALADLDIESEGLTHQDGLAERLARQRTTRSDQTAIAKPEPPKDLAAAALPASDRNAWRRGKALLQVAIDADAHVELAIIAKRRRMTLSQILKSALNDWLKAHGHPLRIPD